MSRDPYHDVKREVESSLSQTRALLSSYLRLVPSTSSSSSSRSTPQPTRNQAQLINEARIDLATTLETLQADLEDLEDSVLAVEESGEMYGMDQSEVRERRRFLDGVKREVAQIRRQADPTPHPPDPFQEITLSPTHPSSGPSSSTLPHPSVPATSPSASHHPSLPSSPHSYTRAREPDLYEQEQQLQMLRQQDSTLDVIGGTLRGLGEMAGLIGREVGEQNDMLDDLSTRVDETDSRLTRANKRLKQFVRKNEESKSGWCIGILIVVLMILLLLVIIT